MNKVIELIDKLTNVIKVTQITGRIWQMDDEGNVLFTYKTVKEASVCTGIKENNIASAISMYYKAGGFYRLRNTDLEE